MDEKCMQQRIKLRIYLICSRFQLLVKPYCYIDKCLLPQGYPVLPSPGESSTPEKQIAAWCCRYNTLNIILKALQGDSSTEKRFQLIFDKSLKYCWQLSDSFPLYSNCKELWKAKMSVASTCKNCRLSKPFQAACPSFFHADTIEMSMRIAWGYWLV